jgi:hypothetical protein
MRTYSKSEVPLLIKSSLVTSLAPLTINIKTINHGDQLTVHVNDNTGHRLLNVIGSDTLGIPMNRLQTTEGMQTLISGITEHLKSRGYL